VVGWTALRLLLILSCVLGLATKQVDYTAAFIHAPLGEEEQVFVEHPRGFGQPGKVLRLNRSLYGLKQSPRNFYTHLKGNLEAIGFKAATDVDPCLFISDKCICLVYVDDTLFYSPKEEYMQEAIDKLLNRGMEMTIEDSVAGFLGVHIDRNESNSQIKLTQKGLKKRVIEALDIGHLPIKHTPAAHESLGIDKDGDPPEGTYSYPSVIGMLLYLSGHSRPDIAFAVSQCGRFIHNTKRSHEMALERIGQYLKGTMEEGLILSPNDDFDMECHVDADFAGLWAIEETTDPTCVKSRTGFVISISGCPVILSSKLQGDIAGSTMEAEYNALSSAMRAVIPMQTLFQTVGQAVGIGDEVTNTFKTTVWEDNMGCLRLARMDPGQYTPRSKHYGIKYHWFRSHLKPTRSTILHIETHLQKADILTKGLRTVKFRDVRKLLCGW
jgi:Reverse transcriptase (RNA-dependent DNA polymerase)